MTTLDLFSDNATAGSSEADAVLRDLRSLDLKRVAPHERKFLQEMLGTSCRVSPDQLNWLNVIRRKYL